MCINDRKDFTWDDVRLFLEVARAGSLLRAAEILRVSRPTVSRHIEELEQRLGLVLFERGRKGLNLTSAGARLVSVAEDTERSVVAFSRAADAAQEELVGPIDVTLPEFLGADLLMPDFVAFGREWPRVDLRFHASYDVADLERRDAHVALRVLPKGKRPKGDLVGRRAATIHVAVYGRGDVWLGQNLGLPTLLRQLREETFPHHPERGYLHGVFMLREACAAGLGHAVLPCFCAEPRLTRQSEPHPAWEIWVLSHPDLARTPRLRIFREMIFSALVSKEARLKGQSTS